MRITADTNILLRITLRDNVQQADVATAALRDAELISVTLPTLCEFCWVLDRMYKMPRVKIAAAVRGWLDVSGVVTDHSAVESGLAMLDAGGDFADGVIAYEGSRLGGEIFMTFDQNAARTLAKRGDRVQLLLGSSR